MKRLFMDFGRLTCCLPLRFALFLKKRKTDGSPFRGAPKGAAVVVCNHVGQLDPFLIDCFFWSRRVYFLASKQVMQKPVAGALLRGMGCISIDRENADLDAVRSSVELLKGGNLLGVFPQGGIRTELTQIRGGAILIALRAGVPIIPMYTARRKRFFERRLLIVGEPFDLREYCTKKFPGVADIERLSALLLERMERCRAAWEEMKGEEHGHDAASESSAGAGV